MWEELLGHRVVEDTINNHSSKDEKLQVCSDIYINCKPDSSWEELVAELYKHGDKTALDLARPFIPPRGEVQARV